MPDLLKDIRKQLDARLAELRPLVDEHGRLNAAMKALSETKPQAAPATPASSPVKTTSARAHKPPPAKRRKRAPRGANRQAVLQAASERPGATRAELAERRLDTVSRAQAPGEVLSPALSAPRRA